MPPKSKMAAKNEKQRHITLMLMLVIVSVIDPIVTQNYGVTSYASTM